MTPSLPPAPFLKKLILLRQLIANGAALEAAWKESFKSYKAKYPKEGAEFEQLVSGALPAGWEKARCPA